MNILTVKLVVSIIIGIILFVPIIIVIHYNKIRLPIQVFESSYLMYHPKKFWRLMIICTIGDYAFVILGVAIYEDTSALFVIIPFLLAAIVSACLAMYAILWRAVVDNESMTIYAPCFPVRYFKFYEISKVKQMKDGLVKDWIKVYVDGKKVFEIDEEVAGFHTLYEQLCRAGKIETSQFKESFLVKNTKEDIIRDIAISISLFGIFIVALIKTRDEIELIYFIGMGIVTAISIWSTLDTLLWRIIVTYDTLYIRTGIYPEKVYAIKDITAIYQEKNRTTLFSGKKKVVEVAVTYENYSLFLDRMRNLKVDYYKYGKLQYFR